MRVLITTIGTAGDVHPYVGIGLALKARGHEVVVMANPYFKERILQSGLGFWGLGTSEEYLAFVKSPDLVTQSKSVDFVMEHLLLGTFEQQVRTFNLAIEAIRPDLVFAHHLCFGILAACEVSGQTCAQGVLSPMFWLSRQERIMLPTWPLPRAPGFVHDVLRVAMRPVGRVKFDGPVNRLRKSIGAKPVRGAFAKLARGGDGLGGSERLKRSSEGVSTLGLWSEAFRERMSDDPITGTICGFSQWDRASEDVEKDREILAWMEESDRQVVLVTLGSSVSHHGEDVYEMAARACRELGVRGVMLADGVSDDVVKYAGYVAYGRIMPRASVIVHHAGIGTTAAAMRAGKPSVIIPFANDEFDNAYRAEKHGVASVIVSRKLNQRRLASEILDASTNTQMHIRAQVFANSLSVENGAKNAAEVLERVVTPGSQASRH